MPQHTEKKTKALTQIQFGKSVYLCLICVFSIVDRLFSMTVNFECQNFISVICQCETPQNENNLSLFTLLFHSVHSPLATITITTVATTRSHHTANTQLCGFSFLLCLALQTCWVFKCFICI